MMRARDNVMDVMVWLRSLGLGKYEAAFRENEIDEAVLPSLTHETLKELGVSAVGHRLKLLDAIAALRTDAGAEGLSADAGAVAATPSVSVQDGAERRQVTVMFSDLVGSTALSARMDPEDLREVISAYQKCVAETVRRFGGFVAKYMGDGVLVYFGYPEAHEDDAERAVRAGLDLIAAVGSLKTHTPLQTRVGIATGLVVVGDLIGSGASQEQAVVGETPNLAARLQGIAEPNSVVIAESTRKLLGDLFELENLGARDLKGVAGPVRAWGALRPSSVESRFEALHAGGLTELVGREEEVELLLRRWSKAKAGEGQVVLLSGEAGIGKSRLTAALLEKLASEPHTRLRYFCSPQHTDSAFYPIIGQMERAAGLARDDTPQAKLDKLDAMLALASASKQDGGLFAELLSLPNDGRYPTLDLTPQQRRQKTLDALTAQMEGLSRANPLLMIFEDAHWGDPTSLEAFGRAIDRLRTLRVLLLVTFRPEFQAAWIGRAHVTSLMLNRLTEREAIAMIDRVAGNKALPDDIRQDIIERTDGIPLFVEEITKAVLEAENEGATERAVAAIPSPSMAVPASLHASLMARLDRLGPAKEVAQVGAVIGREFPHALIAAVARKGEPELRSALDRLIDAGLLFRQGAAPHATYLFKHALVQDAAYGTLLREPRRALHARIAETLENRFTEIAENQPELLARHCTEAGLIEKAARLWGKAGERSVERSALVEAVELLTRALGQIATLPSGPALRREQIKLQVALISPLMHVKGHAAPETKAATDYARFLMEQAEKIGEATEDPLLLFTVLYGFSIVNYLKFDGEAFRATASEFLALAQKHGATVPLVTGHRLLGHALLLTGDIVGARAHYSKSLALYDPAEHRALAMRIGGQDAEVAVLTHRGRALWLLGYPTAALADAERAVAVAREVGHVATLMFGLTHAAFIQIHCGQFQSASEMIDEAAALADEKNSATWKAPGQLVRGWVSFLSDNSLDAVRMLASGLAAFRSSLGATVWRPLFLSYEARALSQLGQFSDAWQRVDEAMTTVATAKERVWEAEVHRTAGEITLASREADAVKAEAYFDHALTVARQQQAKSWELLAAMSMARLWRDQGKSQQARELLAPVYGWFTEGFDTRDLKEAKALLAELAS
jgi:class 3 adenylate cyclase/predicted ATPase